MQVSLVGPVPLLLLVVLMPVSSLAMPLLRPQLSLELAEALHLVASALQRRVNMQSAYCQHAVAVSMLNLACSTLMR